MRENNNFASVIRKFWQKYWREITVIFMLAVLATSFVAYLSKRRQKKRENEED